MRLPPVAGLIVYCGMNTHSHCPNQDGQDERMNRIKKYNTELWIYSAGVDAQDGTLQRDNQLPTPHCILDYG
jgi:hypothetical protein